jgi:O-succinylbenzoic acid--CoA ligase
MKLTHFLNDWNSPSPFITLKTSGSTGDPKPISVEKKRMVASARRTCQALGLREGDTALLCLPLKFIAGKMMVVRSFVGGLKLIVVEPSGHPLQLIDTLATPVVFAAMTPMQVYNSMMRHDELKRLKAINKLIIGGGPVSQDMAAELLNFPNEVWSTYGMTETLSHIALRKLSGSDASEWYEPLPGISLSLNSDGCLVVDAPDICPDTLITRDRAEIIENHGHISRFRILGRIDNVINSGGVKIQIEEVERVLEHYLILPFVIVPCPDPKFGQTVVLLTTDSPDNAASIIDTIPLDILPKFHRPRHIIQVDDIPLTPTGKPARALAARLAAGYSSRLAL